MSNLFNEDNTIEQMVISALQGNGWKYIPADELPRDYSDVLVEPMVKEALIRLNPATQESRLALTKLFISCAPSFFQYRHTTW